MFKSKLQELCQSKKWNLPVYTTSREGQDHCPQFGATVNVNGSTFSTPNSSKSSKEAHNAVAQLAFNFFSGASQIAHSSIDAQQPKLNEPVPSSFSTGVSSLHSDDKKVKDMEHLYKNRLQAYTQRRNINLPVYSTQRDGPPHALRFKSKVTVDGNTYESAESFSTLKDAEHAAAKAALMSLSTDNIEEEDPAFFKNLLQELAQREYSCLPNYCTTRSGPPHDPIFVSTVEIHDLSFTGEKAKTKKLGEMYAAKVAYIALKDRLQQGNEAKVTKVSTGEAQVISEPEVDTLPFQRADSSNLPVAPSRDLSRPEAGVFNENFAGSSDAAASSRKRIRVFPVTPNMILPAGATIMRKDGQWVAMTMDSTHDI